MNGLKLIRTMCNYSQAALAEKLGVTRQAVNMWENSRKPIPESRKGELSKFFGIGKSEWLDDIDEETFNEIRSLPLYKRVDGDTEHFHFSATDQKYGDIPMHIPLYDMITLDEKCDLKRLEFKRLLTEIQAFAEDTGPDVRNSNFRVTRINTATKVFGDILSAMDTVFKQTTHLKMLYLYAVFATLDGVNIALDIVSKEDYLNSADPINEIYDTRELAVGISKMIGDYLERSSSMIEERIVRKDSASES